MLIQDIVRRSLSQWTFTCQLCGETKPKSGPSQKCCADCRAKRDAQYHKARSKRNIGDQSACTKCGSTFTVDHSTRTLCADCRYRRGPKFVCVNCNNEFEQTSNRQKFCAPCRPIRIRKMKAAEYQRAWKKPEFRQKRLTKAIAYQNRRYKEVASFNLHKRMRTGINASLKGKKNGFSWESLVGYTVADLMAHLEKQFLPGMSWDNRGSWHIDHRRPLASFKFETPDCSDFKLAWSLQNLQPLWALDNIRKSAKLDWVAECPNTIQTGGP